MPSEVLKKQEMRRKALVLGERGAAQMISRQLESEGFETFFESTVQSTSALDSPDSPEILSEIRSPESFSQLRSLMKEFSRISQGKGTVHPGVTLWGERPELLSIAEEFGLAVISPPIRVLALFGNKLGFLHEADQLGIPHLVQSFDPIHTVREIEKLSQQNGQVYPFVLKAVQGGNGGVFVVQNAGTLTKNLPLWFEQLRRSVGEVILFAERYLESARHIIIPFARFQDGYFQSFPLLDASLQCRYRKIVEFCPASRIDSPTEQKIVQWTRLLAEHCGYVGVGSLEFLVDSSRVFLIGGLPRLSISFHLWDQIAGTQAVSWQLATLEDTQSREYLFPRGHKKWTKGLSMQICAEDSRFLLPRPGLIQEQSQQTTWNILDNRAELFMNYLQGDTVPIAGSGLLGTLIGTAQNQEQLFKLIQGVMNELWIAGSIQTNEQFLSELLSHPWMKEEMFHAGFIDEDFLTVVKPSREVLRLAALICHSYLQPETFEIQKTKEEPTRWLVGEHKIQISPQDLNSMVWTRDPHLWTHQHRSGLSGELKLEDESTVRVCAFPLADRWMVRIGIWSSSVRRSTPAIQMGVRQKPRLLSLVAGRVHSLLFQSKSEIAEREPLLIVESLGVFIPHAVPVRIRINHWKVKADEIVSLGQELADIEYSS